MSEQKGYSFKSAEILVLTEYFITDDGGHLDFQDSRIGMTLKPSVIIYGPPPLLQLDNSTIESNFHEIWRKLIIFGHYVKFSFCRGVPLFKVNL